jgi:excisionase family DNA binding protein
MSKASALLKLSRVAELLDLSSKSVRRMIESRELIAIRVGGQWRVDPRDLAAYLARNRTEPMDLDLGVQRIPPLPK